MPTSTNEHIYLRKVFHCRTWEALRECFVPGVLLQEALVDDLAPSDQANRFARCVCIIAILWVTVPVSRDDAINWIPQGDDKGCSFMDGCRVIIHAMEN